MEQVKELLGVYMQYRTRSSPPSTEARDPLVWGVFCCGAQGRAVIVGRASTPPAGGPATIHHARMVLQWSGGGLFRLASSGPSNEDTITHKVPSVTVDCVKQWIECAPEAIDAWRQIP